MNGVMCLRIPKKGTRKVVEGTVKALISRFDTVYKEIITRKKFACWRQVRGVPKFNDDFQEINIDIPNISKDEQIDGYSRGLKGYI